jgi:hypothetical protein
MFARMKNYLSRWSKKSSSNGGARGGNINSPSSLQLFINVRYSYQGNVYNLRCSENDELVLPSRKAMLMGAGDTVR